MQNEAPIAAVPQVALPEGTKGFDIVLVAIPRKGPGDGMLSDATLHVSVSMTIENIKLLAKSQRMQKAFGPKMLEALADGLIEKYDL